MTHVKPTGEMERDAAGDRMSLRCLLGFHDLEPTDQINRSEFVEPDFYKLRCTRCSNVERQFVGGVGGGFGE
ncbi:hypothetical protein [Halogeometricum limi]|uniref:Uncharacterized protein n=1 Tax=Halogeometricum limi TaxID=555875 RepID=A0A1I6FWD1_9EURY|nr:hypothetical protein [Halogeometricum limi]SFR34218.1 hypothetical protein SAMN04488124_0424 [Halogeometricum limi]